MKEHPLHTSVRQTGVFIGSIILLVGSIWGLLSFYCYDSFLYALGETGITAALFFVLTYYSWWLYDYLRIWPAKAPVLLAAQGLVWGIVAIYLQLFFPQQFSGFLFTLPVRFLLGLLVTIIFDQWYIARWKEQRAEEERAANIATPPVEVTENTQQELIDRIPVKDGSRIHIIRLEEVFYLQASGDYVTIFTTTGQYVKEQTMKYFETHLPPALFVRIHRSYIVQMEQISRIELMEKESYYIRLKNNQSLKASNAGYKLLKERLNL